MILSTTAHAEEKSWNAAGDQSNWFDDLNWYPAPAPTAADRVTLDMQDAKAVIGETFAAKEIVIGGKKSSALSIGNFVTGTVEPEAPTDVALDNRRDGLVTLKGSAGKATLKGTYRSSKAKMDDEPSLLFFIE